MFVPDVLHEFELGVWKAIFTHFMRILYAAGNSSIQALNWRCANQATWLAQYFIDIVMFRLLVMVQFEDFMKMHQL
jgi:hypothetical protein